MEDILKEQNAKKAVTVEEVAAEAEAARLAAEKEANSSAARRRARGERRTADESAIAAAKEKGVSAAAAIVEGAAGEKGAHAEGASASMKGMGKGGLASKPPRVTRRTSSRNAPKVERKGPTKAEAAGLKNGVAINLQKLQPKMEAMKYDFIVIKLHYQCACCHQYILFGNVWRRKPEAHATAAAPSAGDSASSTARSAGEGGTATPRVVEVGGASACWSRDDGNLGHQQAPGAVDAVSFLLCTVTFHANHDHNLTRSP
jgi:hypothetical protein